MIPFSKAGDAFAGLNHNTGPFMAKNGWEQAFGIVARQGEGICVANACRLDFHQNLTGPWAIQINLDNFKGRSRLKGDGCAGFHG